MVIATNNRPGDVLASGHLGDAGLVFVDCDRRSSRTRTVARAGENWWRIINIGHVQRDVGRSRPVAGSIASLDSISELVGIDLEIVVRNTSRNTGSGDRNLAGIIDGVVSICAGAGTSRGETECCNRSVISCCNGANNGASNLVFCVIERLRSGYRWSNAVTTESIKCSEGTRSKVGRAIDIVRRQGSEIHGALVKLQDVGFVRTSRQ